MENSHIQNNRPYVYIQEYIAEIVPFDNNIIETMCFRNVKCGTVIKAINSNNEKF